MEALLEKRWNGENLTKLPDSKVWTAEAIPLWKVTKDTKLLHFQRIVTSFNMTYTPGPQGAFLTLARLPMHDFFPYAAGSHGSRKLFFLPWHQNEDITSQSGRLSKDGKEISQLITNHPELCRWWQLKDFCSFHPYILGEMISIGLKPPTSYR